MPSLADNIFGFWGETEKSKNTTILNFEEILVVNESSQEVHSESDSDSSIYMIPETPGSPAGDVEFDGEIFEGMNGVESEIEVVNGARIQNSAGLNTAMTTANVVRRLHTPIPIFYKRSQLPSVSDNNIDKLIKLSSTVTSAIAISKAIKSTTTTTTNTVLKKKITQNQNELPNLPLDLDSNLPPGISQIENVRWAFSNQEIKQVKDIDEEFLNDPLMGGCYNVNVSNHLFAREIIGAHDESKFVSDTLFMAVNILDRTLVLFKELNSRAELELLCATSLYIAAKYEEVQTPKLSDFAPFCDFDFKTVDVKNMEEIILKKLNFDLSAPLSTHFLRRFSRAAAVSHNIEDRVEYIMVHILAKYILELCLIDYTTIHYLPSQTAAAAIALAMLVFKVKGGSLEFVWNATMEHYTTYTVEDIRVLLPIFTQAFIKYQEKPGKLQAILTKFSKQKYLKISRNPSINPEIWKNRVFNEINLLISNCNV